MKEIFCRFIHKNGRKIYPKKAKFFHFFVYDKKELTENKTQKAA